MWRGGLRNNETGSFGLAEQARQIVAQLTTDGVVGRRPEGSQPAAQPRRRAPAPLLALGLASTLLSHTP